MMRRKRPKLDFQTYVEEDPPGFQIKESPGKGSMNFMKFCQNFCVHLPTANDMGVGT